tara:strand:- start:1197 stop:1427 length:231 start_codon:yes stop_codon:yes gene_type:complete
LFYNLKEFLNLKGALLLVLSRKKDESIMIVDEVEITIINVCGNKVKLGITAPRSIAVHRKEIYDAIQRQKPDQKKS